MPTATSENDSTKMDYATARRKLVKRRAGFKSKITAAVNNLNGIADQGELSEDLFKRQEVSINKWLEHIETVNCDLDELFQSENIESDHPDRVNEVTNEVQYLANSQLDLSRLSEKCVRSQPNTQTGTSNLQNDVVVAALNKLQTTDVKPPVLKCASFSGTGVDKLEFKNFLTQFKNCVDAGGKLPKSAKLTYLRSYLTGYAFKVISHLSIEDNNYDVALTLLTDEFLDQDFIIDESLKQLISNYPKYDPSFREVRLYLNETRALLHELKTYGVDLMSSGSSGSLLASHIIFAKLPIALKRELVHKVNNNYPSIEELFENYGEILKTLVRTSYQKGSITDNKSNKNQGKDEWKPRRADKNTTEPASTLENFKMSSTTPNNTKENPISRFCKFCSIQGHSMAGCAKYDTLDSRKQRCNELKLCCLCTSNKHDQNTCPGKKELLSYECYFCKSKGHISALCNHIKTQTFRAKTTANVCLSTRQEMNSGQPYLLPVITVQFQKGRNTFPVKCLIDTGSQRSYLSQHVLHELDCPAEFCSSVSYDINTFLGTERKVLSETVLEVSIPNVRKYPLPMLIDENFSINMCVADLNLSLTNITSLGYKLHESNLCNEAGEIRLHGLIGVDVLQFFGPMRLVKCMNGSAWEISSGIIPFGNCLHFLFPHQMKTVSGSNSVNIDHDNENLTTHVNFVLEPKHSYFDPLACIYDGSQVEKNLDRMFNLESIGINESEELANNYDKIKIEEFTKNIQFKDSCYEVKLPWYNDKIESVPSNHETSLAVLSRVIKSLENKNLLEDYADVFKQQEREGIIERITVAPQDYAKYIWIPHRPIVKNEEQVTTKIRAVFNCSLRTNDSPSLNDAAYAGVNLMGDLLKLILYFRTNQYVMLSDIRKAFLMIKLASVEDQNRFCFFMVENNKLICFRYKTLIFGFNASPFILNFIIKFHLTRYPNDDCTQKLLSKFYVDNLVITGNSPDDLSRLYVESYQRMNEGGFNLRSWSTNCSELKDQIIADNNLADHGCDLEKVLGYKYSTSHDTLKLADAQLDPNSKTKREVLSQISKIFDPVGMCLPVVVGGKIFMRSLWSQKYGWDETVSADCSHVWAKLHSDLSQLSTLEFSRCSLNENEPADLYVFCDASKSAYGFVVYGVANAQSNFVFAKCKVAPMKTRSLPTLELLAVFLALKCLATLLDALTNIKFNAITLAVDSQVVLSWVLAENVKTKNMFAMNRIKDISVMVEEISSKYNLPVSFKYVPTCQNPADMLTRGLTFTEFSNKLDMWKHGPEWLSCDPVQWPVNELNCLSETSKCKVNATNVNVSLNQDRSKCETIFPCNKYSSLNTLFRVTSLCFKFMYRLRKSQLDPFNAAQEYWLKVMQEESFASELEFLSSSKKDQLNQKIPALVSKLNLFLDDRGLLRCKGRISKTTTFEYEVLNPILLSKHHCLTKLIINDSHKRSKHLGVQTTLNKVRTSGFWIPKGRQIVKSVISQCVLCQKINNLSFKYPKLTNLPKHRVNLVRPFLHVGIDYTGHVWVKNTTGGSQKMYLLIFTCLSVRALHIELVPDMNTQSFVLAFLRFTNSYGVPSHIYSDNAKSFIAGCNLLEEVFLTREFKENFQLYNIKHVRIPLYSAWVGSTWERLIRVVKSCLYKTVGRSKVAYFELITIISDIQAAINSRPLTYRCSDDDSLDIITPNCFIKPMANASLMLNSNDVNLWETQPPSRSSVLHTLDAREEMLSHFRDIWHESYLLGLRDQYRDLHEVKWDNRIKVGDVVLVKLPNKPRPYWLLGRVVELMPSSDNKIRSVKVKRGDGQVQCHSLKHLYPLELSLTHSFQPGSVESPTANDTMQPEPPATDHNNRGYQTERPVRQAAVKCRQRLLDNQRYYY